MVRLSGGPCSMASSQNHWLEQACGPLQLYMLPHLSNMPSTAVAMLRSCRFFKQLLEAAPSSCLQQLARMVRDRISQQAQSGSDLLAMLRQQGSICRSMRTSQQRCIQQLELPPDYASWNWRWEPLGAWPDTQLAATPRNVAKIPQWSGMAISRAEPQASRPLHVYDIKMPPATSPAQPVTYQTSDAIHSPFDLVIVTAQATSP